MTGFSAALPFLLAAMMKLTAGPMSDRLSFLSNKIRVILFTSVSQVCLTIKIIFYSTLKILPTIAVSQL